MSPPADSGFVAYCVELLAPLGAARARRMFGGHGLYVDGLMIGLVAADQLYMKTDAETLPRWQAVGGRPFSFTTQRGGLAKTMATSYWTPPAEAIDSPPALLPWARLALEAALRAQAARAAIVRRPRPPRQATGGARRDRKRPASR